MKTLATIGDNCVDIYPQLNKAFSGGNAVNVAVYCTRYGIQPGCITWVGDDDYGIQPGCITWVGDDDYGIQPGCITWVGDDDYGTKLKQDLARMGVDISHVHTKHGVTAQTQVELHDNDRVFGDYTEGVMADFALSEEDYAWLAQYDIVHAAIWGHAEDAFPQLHAAGKLTAFDFSDKWDSPLWQTLVPHLDFAFASAPQEDEALRLKMKAIVARGAGTVIVTLGENGSIAWDGAQFWRQAPEPVTVIDTMGAGDSFIAGFLCGWSAGMTLPQAMAQGTACAAKTIQYHGAW
ncbi:TPA: fructoselysine 6-kinase [Shigella flexneri]